MADMEKGTRVEPGAAGTNGTGAGMATHRGEHPWQNIGHRPITRIGNPGPLGLTAFASTTLLLSFVNVTTRGVDQPNIVVGMALFVGGLAQLLAGMWEFACGNTFGATAFTSYGAFWGSYASILIPGTGIGAAFETAPDETHNALGLFLTVWFIFTFLMLVAATRRNAGLIALFFFLTITFLLLAVGQFQQMVVVTKAGGAFGIVTAFIAYYVAMAELLRPDDAWFTLPIGTIPKRVD